MNKVIQILMLSSILFGADLNAMHARLALGAKRVAAHAVRRDVAKRAAFSSYDKHVDAAYMIKDRASHLVATGECVGSKLACFEEQKAEFAPVEKQMINVDMSLVDKGYGDEIEAFKAMRSKYQTLSPDDQYDRDLRVMQDAFGEDIVVSRYDYSGMEKIAAEVGLDYVPPVYAVSGSEESEHGVAFALDHFVVINLDHEKEIVDIIDNVLHHECTHLKNFDFMGVPFVHSYVTRVSQLYDVLKQLQDTLALKASDSFNTRIDDGIQISIGNICERFTKAYVSFFMEKDLQNVVAFLHMLNDSGTVDIDLLASQLPVVIKATYACLQKLPGVVENSKTGQIQVYGPDYFNAIAESRADESMMKIASPTELWATLKIAYCDHKIMGYACYCDAAKLVDEKLEKLDCEV